jgi:hypothetical protein
VNRLNYWRWERDIEVLLMSLGNSTATDRKRCHNCGENMVLSFSMHQYPYSSTSSSQRIDQVHHDLIGNGKDSVLWGKLIHIVVIANEE